MSVNALNSSLNNKKIIERVVENSPLTIEIENSFAAVAEAGTSELLKETLLYWPHILNIGKMVELSFQSTTHYFLYIKYFIARAISDKQREYLTKVFTDGFPNPHIIKTNQK